MIYRAAAQWFVRMDEGEGVFTKDKAPRTLRQTALDGADPADVVVAGVLGAARHGGHEGDLVEPVERVDHAAARPLQGVIDHDVTISGGDRVACRRPVAGHHGADARGRPDHARLPVLVRSRHVPGRTRGRDAPEQEVRRWDAKVGHSRTESRTLRRF